MFFGIHGIYAKYVGPIFHIARLLFLFSLLSGCVFTPQESVALVSVPETFSRGAAASYEVGPWARLHNITDAAAFELEATKADYQTAQLTLSAEVALICFKITEATLQFELLKQQKARNTKVVKLIRAQFRSGKTDISDVLQQRQLVESNSGSFANLRSNLRVLEHQRAVLIGQTPCNTAKPFSAHLPELPPLPETGLPLSIPTLKPDIKSSFLSLQAGDQKAAAATANRLALLGNRTTLYRTLSSPIEWATRHKTGKGTTT